jgi:hypothetical protein
MSGRLSLNSYVTRFLSAAVLAMMLLIEAVIIILLVRLRSPHPPGFDLGLAALFICVLVLGIGGFRGHRAITRLKPAAEMPLDEAGLIRTSSLFLGMALVGYIAIIEGLVLVVGLLGRQR